MSILRAVVAAIAVGMAGFGSGTMNIPAQAAPKVGNGQHPAVDVQTVTDQSFRRVVLDAEHPVVVLFYAPWDPHSQRFRPVYSDFAENHSGTAATFAALDVDDNPKAVSAYDIATVPTVLVFDGGRVVGEITGSKSRSQLADELAPYL